MGRCILGAIFVAVAAFALWLSIFPPPIARILCWVIFVALLCAALSTWFPRRKQTATPPRALGGGRGRAIVVGVGAVLAGCCFAALVLPVDLGHPKAELIGTYIVFWFGAALVVAGLALIALACFRRSATGRNPPYANDQNPK